ncbi:MAG TPA: hypothetical protein VJW20_14430 [Candidatus Angelobacter sp.]|nr:hypothetical protein [Candidatus Angelobacter sp.]
MTPEQFNKACGLDSLSEVDKVCHLAFFHLKKSNVQEFNVGHAAKWLIASGGAAPNRTRLEGNLRASRNTVRAPGGLKLTNEYVAGLEQKYPQMSQKSQEIVDEGTILPEADYKNTRGYIETLAKQINACYENNCFDGCAVIMRRLEEVLLILAYRNLNIDAAIKDANGNYFMLEGIVNDARTNSTLNLSRNAKNDIETFRELGNFSAHKIEYTCKREYIRPEIQKFRALVNELLHKAGLRT